MAERHNAKGRTGNPNSDRPNRKAWKKNPKARMARIRSVSNGGGSPFSRRERMGWERSAILGTWGPVAQSSTAKKDATAGAQINGV